MLEPLKRCVLCAVVLVWFTKASEADCTRASIVILDDLMNVDPKLGVKFIQEKQAAFDDHFGNRIIPYIPQLMRKGALDIIQNIPKNVWVEMATRRRFQNVRDGLLLMFSGEIAMNLESLLRFVEEGKGAESIPVLLQVWIQEQPYTCSRRLGVFNEIPEELVYHILDENITMAEELALAQTCHWLNDHLKPRIREKYKELEEGRNRRKFRFSIRKIYKAWAHQERGSEKEAALEKFLTQMADFNEFAPCLLCDKEEELDKPNGYTCLFDYYISRHVNPDVLTLLIKQYPEEVLENFKTKHFGAAWFMDYPDHVLLAVIENLETVPSDILYIVSDPRFSSKLLIAVLKRFKWRLTVSECNYMMTRLRSKDMIEKVLDRLPSGFYNFSASQLRHFLKMGLDNGRLERILKQFHVNLDDGHKLLDALLRKRIASGALLHAISNSKSAIVSSSTIKLAIQLDYGDDVLSVLIELARRQESVTILSNSSEESSDEDWLLQVRTFGSGVLLAIQL